MDLVIIGTGNTATVLGKKLNQAGHRVLQVLGRDEAHTTILAEALATEPIIDPGKLSREAEVYLLAVSDRAIPEVVDNLPNIGKKIIAHTAASVSKDVLKPVSENYGVFYPYQTLRKEVSRLPEIPVIVDGSNSFTINLLKELAKTISETVEEANDENRVKMHLAAVMVNNFANHLYALAADYCSKENLDFKLLLPLIQETATRIKDLPPSKAQTGPAIRNDQETIQKHLQLLKDHPQLKELYTLMTESIQQFKR